MIHDQNRAWDFIPPITIQGRPGSDVAVMLYTSGTTKPGVRPT